MTSCEKCAVQLDVSTTFTGKDSPLFQHKRSCTLRLSHGCRSVKSHLLVPFTRSSNPSGWVKKKTFARTLCAAAPSLSQWSGRTHTKHGPGYMDHPMDLVHGPRSTFCIRPVGSPIDHFTVVGRVTWLLNGSEAGVDLFLIQTSLFLLCKSNCSYAN